MLQLAFYSGTEFHGFGQIIRIRTTLGNAAYDAVFGNESRSRDDCETCRRQDVAELKQRIIIRAVAVYYHCDSRVAISFQIQKPLRCNGGNPAAVHRDNGKQWRSGWYLLWFYRPAQVYTLSHAGAGYGCGDFRGAPSGAEDG